jgi:hypothetical protein
MDEIYERHSAAGFGAPSADGGWAEDDPDKCLT